MIRVLLIDHSLGHSNNVRELLDVSDANDLMVDCVTTQPELLKGLRSHSYDVCILDSLLDNGIKLFAQARSLNLTVPIVLVVSGSAGLVVEAMRNGVDDCLIRDELNAAQIERTVCAVAERTRYRSLQRQRERRHLAFLDNAVEIVYTHDLEGNFTSVNRAGERLSGYAETELLAMNIRQLVMPESREIMSS